MNQMLTPPAEGPAPYYNGAPADAQPMDLEGALAMVDSIIFRDGGMDQQEQAIFGAWVQNVMLKAQALAAQGMQSEGQQQGLGSSGAQVEDYDAFGATGANGSY